MEKTIKQPHRKYDAPFKQKALRPIDNGQRMKSVACSLGISEALLYQWRNRQKPMDSGQSDQIKEINKHGKQLEVERDILKKALTIFGRLS